MGTQSRFWLALPLFFLCLAFDPADEHLSSTESGTLFGRLLETEARLLSAAESPPPSTRNSAFGAEPYRILHLPGTDRYVILLRNASEIVLCDSELRIIDRSPAPRQPVALDLMADDILVVGGELSGTIGRYRIHSTGITALPGIPLSDVVAVRDLVYAEQVESLFLIDEFSRNLIQVRVPPPGARSAALHVTQRTYPVGPGPQRILSVPDHLIINEFLAHTLLIVPLSGGAPDFGQASRIVNKGPFWSATAWVAGEKLLIAAGGAENRPLDRGQGEFGNMDSWLFLFSLEKNQRGIFSWQASDRQDARRFRAVNLSQHGVLTPKALVVDRSAGAVPTLWATGYGSARAVACSIDAAGIAVEHAIEVMPGISDAVLAPNRKGGSLVYASPLLDRVVKQELTAAKAPGPQTAAPLDFPKSPRQSHLGELLFFTELMAPNNSSRGALSRFTCEACHIEGKMDGRVHFTGRRDIHAATKPVHGLANNVPLFSRCGDETLSAMVMAEFQVANQNRKGVFSIPKARYAWTAAMPHWPETLSPFALRQGLVAFFVDFTPSANPWRIAHPKLTDGARRGLAVFRDRCADCHQPIRSTRTGQGVAFPDWERWLTADNQDLVWGAPFFARTGVTPYVDPAGARVPSLRRVWSKYPLFTNGSCKTIRDVLEAFRYQGTTTWHRFDAGRSVPAKKEVHCLSPQEIADLEMLLHWF
jgi:mono/diheme cytochrome c family protein